MKSNAVDWKLIDKKELKVFKKWLKNNDYLFTKNFYTKLFNINKLQKAEKHSIEFLIYNQFVKNNEFNDLIKEETFLKVTDKEFRPFISKIIATSIEKKFEPLFLAYMELLFDLYDYTKEKKAKHKNKFSINALSEEDLEKEYLLAKRYWNISEYLRKSYLVGFNNWILFINKKFYEKEKGFILKV